MADVLIHDPSRLAGSVQFVRLSDKRSTKKAAKLGDKGTLDKKTTQQVQKLIKRAQ